MTVTATPPAPLDVFYSYAHENKGLVKDLIASLALLRQRGLIKNLFDCQLVPGQEWDSEIRQQLDKAEIILLCVSRHFLDSDYIYGVELQAAMDKHAAGTATVIPVILEAVDWGGAPFAKLQALPTEARPIMSWPNLAEALTDVSIGVRRAIEARAVTPGS